MSSVMAWVALLLSLISGYAAIKLFELGKKHDRLKFFGLTVAACIFLVMNASVFFNFLADSSHFNSIANAIVEWGQILCLAFVLSSLAIFIRESKPVFAQFPMLYTGLPLLIVLSYLLVKDTYALKKWLLMIYQGGAIVVALLMYAVYTYKRQEYTLVLIGSVLFLIAYILFWYVPGVQDTYSWSWKLMVAGGIVSTVIGYEKTEAQSITEMEIAADQFL